VLYTVYQYQVVCFGKVGDDTGLIFFFFSFDFGKVS